MNAGANTWMKYEAFAPGGPLDQATAAARKAHGSRAIELWQQSVITFAAGRPISTALVDAHDRQSLQHYALARAAGYASVERRVPRETRMIASSRGALGAQKASIRDRLGWGRR